jgi:hypothetical protein
MLLFIWSLDCKYWPSVFVWQPVNLYSYYLWYIINEKVPCLLVSPFWIFGSIIWTNLTNPFKNLVAPFTDTQSHTCILVTLTHLCKQAHQPAHPCTLLWMWILEYMRPRMHIRTHICECGRHERPLINDWQLPMEVLFIWLPWAAYSASKEINWAMCFITT